MRTRPLALVFWTATAAVAESASPPFLEVTVTAEQLVVEQRSDGTERRRFVPARSVRAEEEVHYTVRIRNPADEPARNVVVTRRVPANTQYVSGSAVGPAAVVSYSIDDGVTFAAPEGLEVLGPDGEPDPATAADYTHIRWRLTYPLAPEATALARFRVVLR